MISMKKAMETVDFEIFLVHYCVGHAEKYKFPEYFYDLASTFEVECGEIVKCIKVDEIIDSLCSVYESHPEKSHLREFLRMKLERDMEL
jgi:hypothetical protein